MVFGKTTDPITDERLARINNFSTFKNQISTGLNMIASVFVCFGIGYYIAKQMRFEEKNRLVIGLVCGVIIMFIEMTLFILRAVRVDDSGKNEHDATEKQMRPPRDHTNATLLPPIVNASSLGSGSDSRSDKQFLNEEVNILEKKKQ